MKNSIHNLRTNQERLRKMQHYSSLAGIGYNLYKARGSNGLALFARGHDIEYCGKHFWNF
jgi:hypothetical protein